MKADNVMGCSIYYNAQKYECLELTKHPFIDETGSMMNQLYVLGKYRHIETSQIVNVATTHLKAKKGFEDIREVQAKQLARELGSMQNLIVTGDFNDEPNSKAVLAMKEKFNHACMMAFDKEVEYTTYKYRESHGWSIRTIDYVFTTKQDEGGITGVNRFLAVPGKD